MNSRVDQLLRQRLVRVSALLIVLLALGAALLQGLAEQGGVGSDLSPVPDQPLAFPREKVFGLDLSDRPSLEAVQWLESGGAGAFGLVVVPVDADIIAALLSANERGPAFQALDQLMAVTTETTVALCLDRPVTQVEDDVLAELTVDTLRDRYPDRIAYLTACPSTSERTWAASISEQVRYGAPALPGRLVPLSTGAMAEIEAVSSFDDLRAEALRSFAGDTYALPRVHVTAPLGPGELEVSSSAIQDAAQVALILLQPDRDLDPAALTASIANVQLDAAQLPEGFSSVHSPAIHFSEQWQPSMIGRISYRHTAQEGALIQSTFVGTTIYLQTLLSPSAGSVAVWIDPEPSNPGPPFAEIDLSASQATDAAVVLAEGLAAGRHTIAIMTTGGEVTVSGLFVSGQPETGWHAGVTTLALVAIASVAMAVVGLARVQDIRDRNALPPLETPQVTHPRAYGLDEK